MNHKIKVIQPFGIFDGRKGRKIHEEMTSLIEAGTNNFLIDFQLVTFMDSSGFGTLLLTLKTIREKQGRLALCGINDQVKMILEISDTAKVFEVFPNQESFMEELLNYQS